MKEEIMQKLAVVANTLNTVEVKGEQNLAGLAGSIQVIREVINALGQAEIAPAKQESDVKYDVRE